MAENLGMYIQSIYADAVRNALAAGVVVHPDSYRHLRVNLAKGVTDAYRERFKTRAEAFKTEYETMLDALEAKHGIRYEVGGYEYDEYFIDKWCKQWVGEAYSSHDRRFR